MTSAFLHLHDGELEKLGWVGNAVEFGSSALLRQEGHEAGCVYFVDSGRVSLYIDKTSTRAAGANPTSHSRRLVRSRLCAGAACGR